MMKLIDQNFIMEKAKTKKDGCYRIRGIAYRVRDGHVTHFACNDQIIELCHGFNVVTSTYDSGYAYSDEFGQQLLKDIN